VWHSGGALALSGTTLCGNGVNIIGAWTDGGGNMLQGSCDGDGRVVLSVPAQFATIQSAIDASYPGDTIEVGPGLYPEGLNFGGRAIVVRSTGGPAVTVIDPLAGRCFTANGFEPASARLEGFTLRGGSAEQGGGVYVSGASPTFVNCTVTGNSATSSSGGGVYISGGSSRFVDCTVSLNTCVQSGGGIYVSGGTPTLENCSIFGNTVTGSGFGGGAGGGLYMTGSASVTLLGGSVSSNSAPGNGGGVCMESTGALTADGWTLASNTSARSDSQGGGLFASGGSVQLTGCTIRSNSTAGNGGGISSGGSVALTDCVLHSNESDSGVGGWRLWGAANWIQGCRVHNNLGATVGGISIAQGTLAMQSTDCCGNGVNIFGEWSDGGGNTFQEQCDPFCPGDSNGDTYINAEDIAELLSDWGPCLGTPCYSDFTGDGRVDGADLSFVLSNWGRCPGW
jgi:parallel beta-helix repeat protein